MKTNEGHREPEDLALLEEEIAGLGSAIEELKSKEQGAPLEAGCALFGIAGAVILILAFFATIARSYFGSWLFYVLLAAAVLVGLARMRRRLTTPRQRDQLREERVNLEAELAHLEALRDQLQSTAETIDES